MSKLQLHKHDGAGCVGWICFFLFWCVPVLIFDSFIGWQILSQWKTLTYLETVGTVTHSKVKVSYGGDKPDSYTPEIHYNYSVKGEQYSGEVYKFTRVSSARARQLVKEHPVGKAVLVYYSSDQPQRAVLFKGLVMRDAYPITFMIPVNGIMLIGIYVLLTSKFRRLFRSDEHWFRDFPIQDDGLTIRLRTDSEDLFFLAIVGMSVASFFSVFLIILLSYLLDMGTAIVLGCVATILGGLLGVWLAVHKNRSDKYLFVVDKMCGTLELPRQPDKTPGPVVPFDSIEDLVYTKIDKKSDDDSDKHSLTLHYRSEGETKSAIVISSDHNWSPLYFCKAEEEFTALKGWILRETNREIAN
jgi:hypothetical protein